MKHKNKRITVAAALILLLVTFFTPAVSAVGAADYDFGKTGNGGDVALSAADLVAESLGESLSEKEKAFLDAYSDFTLTYNGIINTSKLHVEYDSGNLYLCAEEYSYTGDNGSTLTWTPEYACAGGVRIKLDDSGNGVIENCSEPEIGEDIKVEYTCSVKLEEEDINSLINLYHDTAKYAADIEDYNEKRLAYDEYCVAKRIYDDAVAKYDKYLSDLEEYYGTKYLYENYEAVNAQYAVDYQKYLEYLNDLDGYREDYEDYEDYLELYNAAQKQLDAVRLIDVKMTSLERTIYSAVMGGTVDQVLENESAIVAAGADKKAVRLAGDATDSVRELMTDFKNCKTDADKYAYYANNYNKFCDSFLQLTQTLDNLYRNNLVRAYLVSKDKNEKYVILVAQLALISNALIDGELRDYNGKIAYTDTWTIDGRTISQILGNETYFSDDNSSEPLAMGYPAEMAAPVAPDKVEEPVLPEKPEKPIEPVEVEAPGNAPAAVENPTAPAANQSKAAAIYSKLSDGERDELSITYVDAAITERTDFKDDKYITLETALTKKYNGTEISVTFKFFKIDGQEYTHTVMVDEGSPVSYDGKESPLLEYTNETGRYVFAGWKSEAAATAELEEQNTVDLSLGFDSDAVLVPVYGRVPAYYDVTWVIDGNEYTESVDANDIPVCPVTPSKTDEGDYCYEFVGWDKEITAPTENTVYTAIFEKKYIVPLGIGVGASLADDGTNVICDASSNPKREVDISALLERISGRRSLTLILPKGTLYFTFSDVRALAAADAAKVKLSYTPYGEEKAKYSVSLLDSDGNILDCGVSAEATLVCPISDLEDVMLVESASDAEKYVKYTSDGGYITFTARCGSEYTIEREYDIMVIPNSLVNISVSSDIAKYNEKVSFTVEAAEGVEILEIVVTDLEGNAVAVADGLEFYVGRAGVKIAVRAKYKTYTITFVANGKVISSAKVEHGSYVSAPNAPSRANDTEYSYEFIGWSPEITLASCDATYVAQYEKTPLPVQTDEGGLKLSSSVEKLFYIAVGAVIVLIIAVIFLVIAIVLRKRRRSSFGSDDDYQDDDDDDVGAGGAFASQRSRF